MNDLTKEAISRERRDQLEEAEIRRLQDVPDYTLLGMHPRLYGNALAQSNIDQSYGRPKYGNDYLEPDMPLTGKPEHYLTGLNGSRCDRLDAPKGVDLDKFRKFCEDIGE